MHALVPAPAPVANDLQYHEPVGNMSLINVEGRPSVDQVSPIEVKLMDRQHSELQVSHMLLRRRTDLPNSLRVSPAEPESHEQTKPHPGRSRQSLAKVGLGATRLRDHSAHGNEQSSLLLSCAVTVLTQS